MFKKILVALVVILLILVVFIATRPGDFKVTRSATYAAPPSAVFAQLNDLHKWPAWSPWVKLDPAMKQGYEGPATGTGSVSTWDGNSNVGSGRMTITESKPDELVKMKLEFFKPMAGTNDAVFDIKPSGTNTTLTWTMTGKNNFISKAVCLFMDMDKMVGGQFESGLANLKPIVEAK